MKIISDFERRQIGRFNDTFSTILHNFNSIQLRVRFHCQFDTLCIAAIHISTEFRFNWRREWENKEKNVRSPHSPVRVCSLSRFDSFVRILFSCSIQLCATRSPHSVMVSILIMWSHCTRFTSHIHFTHKLILNKNKIIWFFPSTSTSTRMLSFCSVTCVWEIQCSTLSR